MDAVSACLREAAENSGVEVQSLSIGKKGLSKGEGGVRFIQATMTGRGTSAAFAKIFNRLYKPEQLAVVESAKLVGSEFKEEPLYYGEMVYKFVMMP